MVNPQGQVEKGRTFPPSLRLAFFYLGAFGEQKKLLDFLIDYVNLHS